MINGIKGMVQKIEGILYILIGIIIGLLSLGISIKYIISIIGLVIPIVGIGYYIRKIAPNRYQGFQRWFLENEGRKTIFVCLYILLPLTTLAWHAYFRDIFFFSEEFLQNENILLFIEFLFYIVIILWVMELLGGEKYWSILIWLSGLSGIYYLYLENPMAFWIGGIISLPYLLSFSFKFLVRMDPYRRDFFGTEDLMHCSIFATLAFSTSDQNIAYFALSFCLVILTFVRSIDEYTASGGLIKKRFSYPINLTIYRFGKPVRERKSDIDRGILHFLIIPGIEKAEIVHKKREQGWWAARAEFWRRRNKGR